MAGSGLLVYLLARADIDRRVPHQADSVLTEFAAFQANSKSSTMQDLIEDFLSTEVALPSELMVGFWDGRSQKQSASDGERRSLTVTPEFESAVADRLDGGGSTTLDTQWGPVYVEVQPVSDATGDGAFVVAHFISDEREPLNRLMRTYSVAALLALGLVTAVAAWQAGRLLRPVRTLRETAAEIEAGDLDRRIPVSGNDDITELTQTFNTMLDRLQSAFTAQQAFLDDAGHELRTPLTVLRGHIELVDPADSDDVERTRDLLLDEVDRMSRLVDDLIVLAKARRPDFVAPAECEIGELLDSVVTKASALGERDWRIDQRATGPVWVDAQRVTQALLQMADNAIKHTERGGLIAFGSDLDAGVLRLWVRDDGPGVPDSYKDEIFERFERGTDTADLDGFGLGLSIVVAIAAGHHGAVSVHDNEPTGALFVIELPTDARPLPERIPEARSRTSTRSKTREPWPAS